MTPSFAQLGVPDAIVRSLTARGITAPFAIQAATIADALDGFDVCGRAPTGSGKTLAFGIPVVATVGRAEPRRPLALVLAPTRELAEQITSELRSFAGDTRVAAVYGGVGFGPQLRDLRRGVDVLVACPGRLEDLIDQGEVDLADVEIVVLDEADRMADMGFLPAVRRLLDQTSPDRQTLLFSATLDGDIATLTRDYQHDPRRHEVGDETPDITSAHHRFWRVSTDNRTETTVDAINALWPAIVFCRTRHGSDRLAKRLARAGVEAATIHGGRSQSQRTRALDRFAAGKVQALVATDVAARGIHVDGVASVIHYDPPEDHKAYLHRSGRTARAGEGGVVVSLVRPEHERDARQLQRDVDLDEPLTAPDAPALRALSPVPTRPRPERTDDGDGRSTNSPNRRAGKRRKPRRRSDGSGVPAGRQQRTKQRSNAEGKTKAQGKGKPKKKARHPAKAGNRKARRAHLQPGARKAS